MNNWFLRILVIALAVVAIIGISWIATCGVIWAVCALLGKTFSWKIATAIWLILGLIGSVVRGEIRVG